LSSQPGVHLAILTFLRPEGALGDGPIVMVRDSDAHHVRIGDTMHPVLNWRPLA
jgi:hypothetical protein